MAKQTLTVQLMLANARIAELEATLVKARTCYAELRASIHAPVHADAPAPITTRFTKADGSVWVKTRIGNRAVSHQVA